jgi:hypothetical protein
MQETEQAPVLTGAQQTEPIRRLARLTYLLRRARRDVETDPKLTEAERAEVAQIWLDGPTT